MEWSYAWQFPGIAQVAAYECLFLNDLNLSQVAAAGWLTFLSKYYLAMAPSGMATFHGTPQSVSIPSWPWFMGQIIYSEMVAVQRIICCVSHVRL